MTATVPSSLIRNRDYVGWWIGETVNGFGSGLSTIAYPLLILAVTGSATRAGIVAAALSVGRLVTLLIGGALADRLSRRALLTYGPLIQAVAVGTVFAAVAAGRVNIVHVTVVGLFQGIVSGLVSGAALPALRRVVPPEQLTTAFSAMSGRDMAVRMASPATGGLLFSIARWIPFLADALSFVGSTVGVLLIRTPLGPDVGENSAHAPILASIRDGLRYIRGSSFLRFLAVWTAVMNCCVYGLMMMVILLVRERGGGPSLIGAVSGLSAAGGLAGSFFAPRISRLGRGRTVGIVLSWVTFGAFAAIAVVPSPWLVGVLLAAMYVLVAPINVILNSYEVRLIPDELMGRVASAITFCAQSLVWLGPLGAGFTASEFGATTATLVLAGAVGAVTVGLHFASGLHVLNVPIGEVTPEDAQGRRRVAEAGVQRAASRRGMP